MRRFFASLDAALCAAGRWLIQPLGTRIAVATLLSIHAGLLAYSATQHSPTHLEPAFLVSGISHWDFQRFELYRVNPPLVRMVAAIPALLLGGKTDWSRYYVGPESRAEYQVGKDFLKANGPHSVSLIIYARWACIPFSLIGSYIAFRWARELYASTTAGIAALVLYIIEPNLLAHGDLITPDAACAALGVLAAYTFWRWLKRPTWGRAVLSGTLLGVAQLTKFSWLVLFGLWPLLWGVWTCLALYRAGGEAITLLSTQVTAIPAPNHCYIGDWRTHFLQLVLSLSLAVYVINCGYIFDGTGVALGDFHFVSRALTDQDASGQISNRFCKSWIGPLPVPLPRQYVLGADTQRKDLEGYDHDCYLRGEWKRGGWWYYYLYGFAVKVPFGTLALILTAGFLSLTQRRLSLDELILIAPAATLLCAASLHTPLCIHFRYVLPCMPFCLIFASKLFSGALSNQAVVTLGPLLLLCLSGASLLRAYPNHLSYFNELAGGSKNGYKHLLGSSFDWGQNWLHLNEAELSRAEWGECTVVLPASLSFLHSSDRRFCFQSYGRNEKLSRYKNPIYLLSMSEVILACQSSTDPQAAWTLCCTRLDTMPRLNATTWIATQSFLTDTFEDGGLGMPYGR